MKYSVGSAPSGRGTDTRTEKRYRHRREQLEKSAEALGTLGGERSLTCHRTKSGVHTMNAKP